MALMTTGVDISSVECLDRETLATQQACRLERLLAETYRRNPFYKRKLGEAGVAVHALRLPNDLARLPLTAKSELVADQAANPPWGTALGEPIERYTRYCQTSSSTGLPLRWLDTNESWQWILECCLGFWSAFDAGCQIGAQCVPGGGMSSQIRLRMIETIGATVVCCTPTYALRLADLAAEENGVGKDAPPLSEGSVRVLIVAGEPGGSIAATRERIERSWGARVIDHHGLTETGPISFECWESPGALHVNEGEYICEVLDPSTGRAVPDGQEGELVVTNLGRAASPVIRYRTGDMVVRRTDPCRCGRTWARLEGGILARVDDMVNIRGVNVYPTAIESVVRRFPEIVEFRSTASRNGAMRTLSIEIEPAPGAGDLGALAEKLSQQLFVALGLTVPVRIAEPGSLPRFEMKARRFVIEP